MKDSALRDACNAYASRIRRHGKLEIVEVRDGGQTDKRAAVARRDERQSLLKAIPDGARIVALTRLGKAEASSQFAKRLGDWRDQGLDIAFVIGGAHGLAEDLLNRADFRLSISHMTLPHELARLVLLEQLYRALTIMRGEPYHKGG